MKFTSSHRHHILSTFIRDNRCVRLILCSSFRKIKTNKRNLNFTEAGLYSIINEVRGQKGILFSKIIGVALKATQKTMEFIYIKVSACNINEKSFTNLCIVVRWLNFNGFRLLFHGQENYLYLVVKVVVNTFIDCVRIQELIRAGYKKVPAQIL